MILLSGFLKDGISLPTLTTRTPSKLSKSVSVVPKPVFDSNASIDYRASEIEKLDEGV
jgi:hypothetical protein